MNINQIRPFVRFARYMPLDNSAAQHTYIPLDARLFYTLAGEGEIRTGEHIHKMTKASLLLIPAGISYRLLTPKISVQYFALNFDYTQAHSDLKIPIPPHPEHINGCPELIEQIHFSRPEFLNGILYLENMKRIENTLIKLDFEFSGRLNNFENKTSAYLIDILTECVREKERKCSYPDGSNCKINEIIHYIQQNYHREISNKQLAEIFHFHPNYISSMMTLYTGMPLHRYLLHVRITNAINLLETTNLSISEIAAETGFYDSNYFSRYFKRLVGKSPKQFRKR